MGPWSAERALEIAVHEFFLNKSRLLKTTMDEGKKLGQEEQEKMIKDFENMEAVIQKLENFILTSHILGDDTPPPTAENISPKVMALIDVLKKFEHVAENFCGIIFCKTRWTATVLQKVIQLWPGLEWIRPGSIVGHGSTRTTISHMTIRGQTDIMQKFRSGRINLLIATQVAEEGLDIQSCALVIRFDMFDNVNIY
jgi:ERCC4-related helicase